MKLIYSHDQAGKRVINQGPTSIERIADVCGEFWVHLGVAAAIRKKDRLLQGHSLKTPNGRWLKIEY